MEKYVVFITQHWVLSTLFAVTLSALLISEWVHRRFGIAEVTPEQAVQLINHQSAVVFDSRIEAQFLEGHILGALNVTALQLDQKMGVLQKYLSKPVIVVSTPGRGSISLVPLLKQKGFTRILQLNGGIHNWTAAGLPLVKS